MKFYAYLFRDIDGTPIYVGKGCGDRSSKHILSRNKSKLGNTLRKRKLAGFKLEPIIYQCTDEELAFFVEEELIIKYGRSDIGTGTLFNLTDGGEGIRNISDSTRLKMSESAKNRKSNIHKPHSNDTKISISKTLTGIKRSEETKYRMKVAQLKRISVETHKSIQTQMELS